MKNFIDSYNEIKKYIDKHIKIPIIFIVFIIDILLIHFEISISRYFEWFPNEIKELMLSVGNLIYSNFILIATSIIIVSSIIFVLGAKFGIPKANEMEYDDGQIEVTNFISAYKRLLNILLLICTHIWILYTTLRLILEKDTGYFIEISMDKITIDHILYIWNIFVLIYIIFIKLYTIKIPNIHKKIEIFDLDIRYIALNKKVLGNLDYLIIKDKNLEERKYFLVSKEHNTRSKYFKIINESQSMEEIDYHFKNLDKL